MKAHGILMQDEMVRALLRPPGDPLRKTVTRRTSDQWARRSVGDLLWVRECFATWKQGMHVQPLYRADFGAATADELRAYGVEDGRWRPSIRMPRWASRLTLRVVSLRREHCAWSSVTHRWVGEPPRVTLYGSEMDAHRDVPGYERVPHYGEHLPWVDDAEARREGVEDRAAYLQLWESINGDTYPTWVWRIEFEEVTRG